MFAEVAIQNWGAQAASLHSSAACRRNLVPASFRNSQASCLRSPEKTPFEFRHSFVIRHSCFVIHCGYFKYLSNHATVRSIRSI
jgi:hypothetical protein